MTRQAKIYLLAVDAEERRILIQLPDSTFDCVEKIKSVFGKEARLVGYEKAQPGSTGASQPKRT